MRRKIGSVHIAVAVSIAGTMVAGIALAIGSTLVVDSLATENAQDDVAKRGSVAARVALAPHLNAEFLAGDIAARAQLDAAARSVMTNGGAVHLKIWNRAENILWSDERGLVGQSFELDQSDRELFGTDRTTSAISYLDRDENALEKPADHKLLEVYSGTWSTNGEPLIVETYYPYALVTQRADALRARFLPVLLLTLGLLAVVQFPLAVRLARRLSRSHHERERLLKKLIETSDAERRRIAAEVHDGVVQDLTGVTFTIAAAAESAPAPLDRALRSTADSTRTVVRSLRSMLTSIYPVEVPPEGVAAGLADVVAILREQGVRVEIDIPEDRLAPVDELLVLRTTREALRNVASHAAARNVSVRVRQRGGRVRLEIVDDGLGFNAEQSRASRSAGHVGLELLRDLAKDAGADMSIESSPGRGTKLQLELAGQR